MYHRRHRSSDARALRGGVIHEDSTWRRESVGHRIAVGSTHTRISERAPAAQGVATGQAAGASTGERALVHVVSENLHGRRNQRQQY